MELLVLAETAELSSQACFSHGPISPIDGWPMFARVAANSVCWSSPPAIAGIVIPAMAMPSIFMPPGVESWDSVCTEWQSEFIEANAQETSHAAAKEDTESISATIE